MDFFVLALPVSLRMPIPRYVYTCIRVYVCVLASLIPRASNVTGPRCRPIVLYAMVLGIVSVSYRARVSCVPFVVHRGVYDAASWRYECLEFINGCRANDKSRVRFVSYPRALSPSEKGEERRARVRSHNGTSSFDELLPCTSRSRLADKSAPVFTRATRLEPGRTGNTR